MEEENEKEYGDVLTVNGEEFFKSKQWKDEDLEEAVIHIYGIAAMPEIEEVRGFKVISFYNDEPKRITMLGLVFQKLYVEFVYKNILENNYVGRIIVPGNNTMH